MSVTGVVGGRRKTVSGQVHVGEIDLRRKGWSFKLERNTSPGGNTAWRVQEALETALRAGHRKC